LLRSQVGVEDVEDAYGNLKEGLIRIKTASEKALDLSKLIELLESEVGFEPVTGVRLELTGQLVRRDGDIVLETSGGVARREFIVARIEVQGAPPPENEILAVVADMERPRSPDRVVVKEWKAEK